VGREGEICVIGLRGDGRPCVEATNVVCSSRTSFETKSHRTRKLLKKYTTTNESVVVRYLHFMKMTVEVSKKYIYTVRCCRTSNAAPIIQTEPTRAKQIVTGSLQKLRCSIEYK